MKTKITQVIQPKRKIIVAVSGGVDSAVAAQILHNQGHEVIGVFLQFWKDNYTDTAENNCCSLESWADAQAVCQKIGIPLYALNFAQEFKKRVVNSFLDDYQNGRTPNPCVLCNKQVKLGRLVKYAKKIGFDSVATGHYIRKTVVDGQAQLWRAKDLTKDQSYFLYQLDQHDLAMLEFPLGDFHKTEIRQMAKDFDLPVAEKAESQEICFVPDNLNNFLSRYLKFSPGDIVDQSGQIVGQHQGLPFYTIGQRRGIEIGGTGPYYVVGRDFTNNKLLVTNEPDDLALSGQEIFLPNLYWLDKHKPKSGLACQAVIRYHHSAVACRIKAVDNGWQVELEEPQRAITPGQSVVFYDEDRLLGGGVIA